jgi:hypothetical protein
MTSAKQCAKCGAEIPSEEVALAPTEPERCHDCADSCEDPACARCAPDRDEPET